MLEGSASHHVIHIVDDDQAIRQSVGQLLVTEGFDVKVYASADAFVAAAPADIAGCLITDVRMPGMTGIELLALVRERALALNVILLTGHADVPMAVQATKKGAVDVIEKPFRADALIGAVRAAMAAPPQPPQIGGEGAGEARARLASLTAREGDVLDRLVQGLQNKVIAYELGISHRTVEIHRGRIMRKSGARSLSELVKLYIAAKS
jgi:two-component system response regulator FixJ